MMENTVPGGKKRKVLRETFYGYMAVAGQSLPNGNAAEKVR